MFSDPFRNPNFGQFALPEWAKRQGIGIRGQAKGQMPLSPQGRIAQQLGSVEDTGWASALMKGAGGFLGARDKQAYQKAQNALTEGLLSGGLVGAIENLQGMDSYYANQALNPLAYAKVGQQQALEEEKRKEAREIEAENRQFSKTKWLNQYQQNAAIRRDYLRHELDMRKEQAKLAAKLTAGEKPNEKLIFDQERVLRDEFSKNSKNYYESLNALKKMKATGEQGTAPSDVSLVTLLFKAVDPASTVTESEQAMLRNSGSFGNKVGGYIRNVFHGKTLTQQQRDEIVKTAEVLVKPLREEHDMVRDWYGEVAAQYGLNPEHILRRKFYQSEPSKPSLPNYNEKEEEQQPGYLLDSLLARKMSAM